MADANDEIKTGIHVSVRARPLNVSELANEEELVVHPGLESGSLSLDSDPRSNRPGSFAAKHYDAKNYEIDNYFGPEDDTEYLYSSTARNLIQNLAEGFNCSVFCYGPTGTGKTYTMFGDEDTPGIVSMVIKDILSIEKPGYDNKKLFVKVVEVYQNKVHDLGSTRSPRRTPENNVESIYGEKIQSLEQAIEIINRAKSQRVTHATGANLRSSRSHCVITLSLKLQGSFGETQISKINLIDLAGSERVKNTGLSGGMRMAEACHINTSLLALKQCISRLAQGKNHIPYRDSKLTLLLEDTLGGNCLTYLIACVSPAVSQWHATRDTLEYCTQARAIKMSAKRHYRPALNLREQVEFLKQQNQSLIMMIRDCEKDKVVRERQLHDHEIELVRQKQELEQTIRENRLQMLRKQQALERQFQQQEKELRDAFERRKREMESYALAGAVDKEALKVLEYKNELEARATGMRCVVCIDAVASHAFLPCGHRCICGDCSKAIGMNWRSGKCPLCKRSAQKISQIFV